MASHRITTQCTGNAAEGTAPLADGGVGGDLNAAASAGHCVHYVLQ